jgi:ORF6N domain
VTNILPRERIERSILLIRGHKVMLDADLAELYGVETRALLQAVSRNQKRFPEDFMFQMSKEEYELLRSQIVISKKGRGGRRYLPYVFTKQGVAMLSSILRSEKGRSGEYRNHEGLCSPTGNDRNPQGPGSQA